MQTYTDQPAMFRPQELAFPALSWPQLRFRVLLGADRAGQGRWLRLAIVPVVSLGSVLQRRLKIGPKCAVPNVFVFLRSPFL